MNGSKPERRLRAEGTPRSLVRAGCLLSQCSRSEWGSLGRGPSLTRPRLRQSVVGTCSPHSGRGSSRGVVGLSTPIWLGKYREGSLQPPTNAMPSLPCEPRERLRRSLSHMVVVSGSNIPGAGGRGRLHFAFALLSAILAQSEADVNTICDNNAIGNEIAIAKRVHGR